MIKLLSFWQSHSKHAFIWAHLINIHMQIFVAFQSKLPRRWLLHQSPRWLALYQSPLPRLLHQSQLRAALHEPIRTREPSRAIIAWRSTIHRSSAWMCVFTRHPAVLSVPPSSTCSSHAMDTTTPQTANKMASRHASWWSDRSLQRDLLDTKLIQESTIRKGCFYKLHPFLS